eukprot:TRINITY_DN13047_c0_g1_i1.p1 TRINITY_DN13047_c0_g1~~TRINITY_DN13047_c0_g1_i1.p1  ORF type:complete len:273 (-),score=21.61 TRINITY_DN13047_c0_g1_i1:55-873(-)
MIEATNIVPVAEATTVPVPLPKEKKGRKKACDYCHRSHVACDESRPCKRCAEREIPCTEYVPRRNSKGIPGRRSYGLEKDDLLDPLEHEEDLREPIPLPNGRKIERIVDYQYKRGASRFLVKWVDLPESENTWEREEDLEAYGYGAMIDGFHDSRAQLNSLKRRLSEGSIRKPRKKRVVKENGEIVTENESEGVKGEEDQANAMDGANLLEELAKGGNDPQSQMLDNAISASMNIPVQPESIGQSEGLPTAIPAVQQPLYSVPGYSRLDTAS